MFAFLQVPDGAVGHCRGERGVFVGDDRRAGALIGQHGDPRLGVVAGDGRHQEQVAKTPLEHGVGGAVAFHHDHVVGFGDGAGAGGEAAGIGAQQEVDPVVIDELLDEIGGGVGVGLVVVVDDLGPVAALTYLDPAVHLIDPLDPGVISLPGVAALHREFAGLAQSGADPHSPCEFTLAGGGGRGVRGGCRVLAGGSAAAQSQQRGNRAGKFDESAHTGQFGDGGNQIDDVRMGFYRSASLAEGV